jgi:RHS repeat-associated protein
MVTYTHGLQPIAQTRDSSESFYLHDAHSGVRALADSTGAVTDSYDYDAYGTLLQSTGTTENSLLYRGEQYDPTLAQYYLRARFYDPATGTFTSMDPWEGNAYDPISLNKYLFANDDVPSVVES